MPRLPPAIDFEDKDFPELAQVFRDIDAGMAALVAGDPAFHPDPAPSRDTPSPKNAKSSRHGGSQRQAA